MELRLHPWRIYGVTVKNKHNFYHRLLSICTNQWQIAKEAAPASSLSHLSATDNGIVRFEILTAVLLNDSGVMRYDAVSPSGSRRLAETNTNNSSRNVWPLTMKAPCYKSCSFRGDRIQWNFLGQTAASGCEGFPTFRDLTPSQTAVLVLPNHQHILKMLSWCYQTTSTPWRCSLGDTKPTAHPEDAVLVLPYHQHTLKMQSWCYQTNSTPWRRSLYATKPPAHPEDSVLVLPNHQHILKIQSCCYQTTSTPWRRSLGATKPPAHPEEAVLVLPNHQYTLKMVTELVLETPEHLHILTRLLPEKISCKSTTFIGNIENLPPNNTASSTRRPATYNDSFVIF